MEGKAYRNPLKVTDFTLTPGLRYRWMGEFSGEEFLEDWLLPNYDEAQKRGEMLVVELDGVVGYSASFLEETFGGLIRKRGKGAAKGLEVRSKSDFRVRRVKDYIKSAVDQYEPQNAPSAPV